MSITKKLNDIEKLKAVGLSSDQAKLIVHTLEEVQVDGHMSKTKKLDTMEKLEATGFSPEKAKVLVDIIEETQLKANKVRRSS
ncbi:MAG: hypothetical protein MRJ65_06560 [Candidatus Brocadiaceae bacterium]|nr:hypothetical protein [Candidatus Brocadiaceae bacterium]